MTIHVIAVGRFADVKLKTLAEDYANRTRHFFKVALTELRPPASSLPQRDRLKREADMLLAAVPPRAALIALTRRGRAEGSTMFARRLAQWQGTGRDLAFLLGGAFGLDRRVLQRCQIHLSLSAFTLPHELARVVLLEQLYRAGTIIRGMPYHKGERSARA